MAMNVTISSRFKLTPSIVFVDMAMALGIFRTQFIRSSGMLWTKYSRCSFGIVHMGRFFCVISSSRSFRSCNRFGNQISSHEQTSGLSAHTKEDEEEAS